VDLADARALDRGVRFAIYGHFAATGEAPATADLASTLERPVADVEGALERLAAAHVLVLAPGTHNLWMAHPFSAVPTSFPVRTAARTYWANCAWDVLGIAALLDEDAESRTTCPDCAEPITLRVAGGRLEPSDAVVHFVVPPRHFWDNVGFT
jgi:hypothetical protein